MSVTAVSESVWLYYKLLRDHLDWTNVAAYSVLVFGSWLVYRWGIQPFLSPLRKVPGMSYNPFFGNLPELMKGEGMEATLKMMHKFGPVFRYYMMFGLERLGLADPEMIRHVTITNSRNYVKPPRQIGLMRVVLGNGLVTSEGDVHAVHKRLMAPAFNNNSITKMVPVFEKNVVKLSEFWKQKIVNGNSAEVNAAADLARTTLDIIGETAFGYDFNSLEQPDDATSKACWEIVSGAGLSYRFFIPYYYKFPFADTLRIRKNLTVLHSLVEDIMKQKRELIAKGTDMAEVAKDVLGMMMLARDEVTGEGLSDEDLQDEVRTLMLAGHETTAVAMSWCLLNLASNPEIQEKARQEVLAELPDDEPLTFESLEKLSFCGNVIKETLRLLPPVPFTIRQALKPDVLPGNIPIPAGTVLVLCIGAMMRRADLYEDPDSFQPERFENKESEAAFHNFLPFLIGPRMCLGYKFALVELRVMLVTFLRHFRFDVIPGTSYKRKMTITMKPNPPLRLLVSSVH